MILSWWFNFIRSEKHPPPYMLCRMCDQLLYISFGQEENTESTYEIDEKSVKPRGWRKKIKNKILEMMLHNVLSLHICKQIMQWKEFGRINSRLIQVEGRGRKRRPLLRMSESTTYQQVTQPVLACVAPPWHLLLILYVINSLTLLHTTHKWKNLNLK